MYCVCNPVELVATTTAAATPRPARPVAAAPTEAAAEAAAAPPAARREAREVGPLRRHLEQPAAEERLVEHRGILHERRVGKLDVRKTLGVTRELITQNGDTVNRTAALEMLLDLFRRRAVVDLCEVRVRTLPT